MPRLIDILPDEYLARIIARYECTVDGHLDASEPHSTVTFESSEPDLPSETYTVEQLRAELERRTAVVH